MSLQIGQQFGLYEIATFLGKGGMCEVYLATLFLTNKDGGCSVFAL
jgi:hypothetical protein